MRFVHISQITFVYVGNHLIRQNTADYQTYGIFSRWFITCNSLSRYVQSALSHRMIDSRGKSAARIARAGKRGKERAGEESGARACTVCASCGLYSFQVALGSVTAEVLRASRAKHGLLSGALLELTNPYNHSLWNILQFCPNADPTQSWRLLLNPHCCAPIPCSPFHYRQMNPKILWTSNRGHRGLFFPLSSSLSSSFFSFQNSSFHSLARWFHRIYPKSV